MDSKVRTGSLKYFGSLYWFVIHTKPRDEHRVESHFEGMEIETLLPLCEDFRYSHGRMFRVLHPLFPNYLFAKLDLEHHYYKVKWTRGVNRILGIGNEPTPVSEIVIQMIRERMGKDSLVRVEDELKEGDIVRITSGPLKDLIGIFQKKISDNGRVKILTNLIGIDVPVHISQWQIKKAA
jgi:transcription elongation factor/antiterminator RfaH